MYGVEIMGIIGIVFSFMSLILCWNLLKLIITWFLLKEFVEDILSALRKLKDNEIKKL